MRRSSPGRIALGSAAAILLPWKMISPAVATSICAIMLRSVDLPAPDGPMMVRNSPSPTEKVRSRMTQGDGSRPWRARESACRDCGFRGAVRGHGLSCRRPASPGRRRAASAAAAARSPSTSQPTACTMSVAARMATKHCVVSKFIAPTCTRYPRPAVRRDQLGDDRGADGVGHADAEAREDVRHRAGKDDVARDLALVGADHLRHLHELGVERAHARRAC